MKPNTKPRHYGRIDEKILAEGIASGLTYEEAGKLAGSKAAMAKDSVNDKLHRSPALKKDIITRMEEKRDKILASIKDDEIERASLSQKMVGIGILTEKVALLKGDPTQRIEQIPKLVFEQRPYMKEENSLPEGEERIKKTPL